MTKNIKNEINIESERLIVRTFKESDYYDLYEYLSNPETYKFEPGRPLSLSECQKVTKERSVGNAFLAIELKTEKKVIGHLYFYCSEENEFMTCELGFITNRKYQRMNYTSEAASALIEYTFKNSYIHRITAQCNPENTASWKLLEKVGMIREGHLIKNIFLKTDSNGFPVWQDTYLYAINKE